MDTLKQENDGFLKKPNSMWSSSWMRPTLSLWDKNKPVKPICPGHCVSFNQESGGCNVTDPELCRLFISIMADQPNAF